MEHKKVQVTKLTNARLLLSILNGLNRVFFVNFDTDEEDIIIAYKCPKSGNPVMFRTPDIEEVIEHFRFFLHPEEYLEDESE